MENDREQYVRAMGPELGPLFHDLRDDFDWLRRKWSEFQELFGKGQERIDVLNAVASNFFYFLHRLLFEDAMLHLCRLTDPPRMRGRETLTVRALADAIFDPALKASVETKTAEVQGNCLFAREWRDQRIAHTDLETLREGYASALRPADSTKIDTAMKSIDDLLTLIENRYGAPHFLLGADPWGAKSLIHNLERAKRSVEDDARGWRGKVSS
jgi:AbiU2